ncbi:MAG TPA: hypothetical protein VKH40_10635 [Alloacidobacterium sp.]|nr:hypothetical protein [Alloacidobacterium sp.]
MGRFITVVMLGSMTSVQLLFAGAMPEQHADTKFVSVTEGTAGTLPALPSIPRGKSTVIGGAIHDVDPVRDQFSLKVFGGRTMKILFDERTQVYRDGVKTPLRDLGPDDHASIETVLDGTNVFALSIHMLSQSPEGECQGQILNYDPGTGELTVSDALSHEPIKLRVPTGTAVVRIGQASTAENLGSPALLKGTLISAKFEPDNKGRGVASQISILATPGSAFVFSGEVTFLDLHSNVFVVVDPRDDKTYKISFNPASFPITKDLHEGTHVRVTANFDGTHYVASAIAPN